MSFRWRKSGIDLDCPTGKGVWNRTTAIVAWHIFFVLFLSLPASLNCQSARPASFAIAYELRVDPQHPHHYTVRVTVPRPAKPAIEFAIPAWTPGYYQTLHFENGIDRVHAQDDTGHRLAITHPAARRWTVITAPAVGSSISIVYDVSASDKGFGFFGSMLDMRHRIGYINGASAFMYVSGLTQTPLSLTAVLPVGWQCATTLRPTATFTYSAPGYDEMVDAPLQLGKFDSFEFKVGDIPFRCVLVGNHRAEPAKVSAVLAGVAREAIGIFGSAPFSQYIFFFHIGEEGFVGGLEHRDSTVIHLDESIADGNDDEFLTTTAHELFHAWNVKWLHPEGLGPFDYSQAVRTPSLWFAEGVTDYYADLLPVRARLRTPEWFAQQLANRIRQLDSNTARMRVTLEQASNQAWEGQSEGFGGLSYYLKGSLVGCYFDLRVRNASRGERSLDDVLRQLIRNYADKGAAYPSSALLSTLNHVAGLDLTADYRRYVGGIDDICWDDVFPAAGCLLHRQADGYLGVRFVPQDPVDETDDRDEADRPAIVQHVEPGCGAAKMDLRPGDRIVTIDGRQVTYGLAGAIIRSLPAAAPVRIVVLRHGKTLELNGEAGTQYSHQTLDFVPDNMQTKTTRGILAGLFASRSTGSNVR